MKKNHSHSKTEKQKERWFICFFYYTKLQYRISRSVTVLIPDDELPCVSFLFHLKLDPVGPKFLFLIFERAKKSSTDFTKLLPSVVSGKKKKVWPGLYKQPYSEKRQRQSSLFFYLSWSPFFFCPGPSFHLIQNGGSFVRLFPLAQLVCLFQHAHSGRLSESIEQNRGSLLPSSSYIKDFLRWPTVCSFLAAILARLWWNFIFVVCVCVCVGTLLVGSTRLYYYYYYYSIDSVWRSFVWSFLELSRRRPRLRLCWI